MSITRDELDALIAAAPGADTIDTPEAVREELDAWRARYFGVGEIGDLSPVCTADGGTSYVMCAATVEGLPLHPRQALELFRNVHNDVVSFSAMLWTSNTEAPYSVCEGSTGEVVACLADLDDLLL
jgi:hypothetical protein